MRLLLWLFPRGWRTRYGEEVAELFRSRDRHLLDVVDLVVTALSLRVEGAVRLLEREVRKMERRLKLVRVAGGVAAALMVVGIGTTWWAMTELADGLRELPSHWWSGLAMAPLLLGLALLGLSVRLQRTRRLTVRHLGDRPETAA